MKFIALLFIAVAVSFVAPEAISDEIKIGLRAHNGAVKDLKKWQPTADYLSQAIPEHHFVMVPFDINSELNQAVSRGEFDFVLTQPAGHVEHRLRYGVTPIATLVNKRKGAGYTQFGSAVFTLANRNDITSFQDLKGKKVMAVDEEGFGGWWVALREMILKDVDPYRDFQVMSFSGGIQQSVVHAVRAGVVDAGVVRTDMLERMAARGEIRLDQFKVIEPRQTEGFGFMHSTQLYPEWPFAKMKNTSEELASKVANALYMLKPDSAAAKAGKYVGWVEPLDYEPVNELLQELRVGPYQGAASVSLGQFVSRYWWQLAIALVLMLSAIVVSMLVMRTNRRLKQTQYELKDYQQHLEEKVSERTSELLASNKELESYSYSIAHDLRAPLRSVVSYSQILEDGAADKLDAEELDAFNRIANAGKHMAALIDDILNLSRITRTKLKMEPVDFSAMVEDVSLSLTRTDPGRKVRWVLQKGMTVTGDKKLLKTLLENLMGNAWKFTRDVENPSVEVGEKVLDEKTVYFVKDNGVGFDGEFVDKIFVPFHRLHRRGFDGTGVGLAIVQRVAQCHGGDVWAESEVGKGATFYFTLGN